MYSGEVFFAFIVYRRASGLSSHAFSFFRLPEKSISDKFILNYLLSNFP